jgi:hypothetical protein
MLLLYLNLIIQALAVYQNFPPEIPSQYPGLWQDKQISGNLLLEPLVTKAVEYIKKTVDPSLLNIPISIYNPATPATPKYSADKVKSLLN